MRKLFGFCRPHWKYFVSGVFLTLFSGVIALAVPFAVRYYIDYVLVAGNTRMLEWVLVGLITAVTASALSGYTSSLLLAHFSENVIKDIQVTLFNHILKLGMEFHSAARTGDLISRVVSDTVQLQRILGAPGVELISALITLVISIVVMLLLSWKLAILSLIVFPLFVTSANFFSVRIRGLSRKLQQSNAERIEVLSHSFYGIRDMKMLGVEDEFLIRFKTKATELVHSTIELIRSISAYREITGAVGGSVV